MFFHSFLELFSFTCLGFLLGIVIKELKKVVGGHEGYGLNSANFMLINGGSIDTFIFFTYRSITKKSSN
ncbi:hypothetical protein HanIR_Chr04g0154351 [Helianthus annuus]|nr:hypothetical protein HanIR_Chr04g0154351 [Helianthus annuus]